mgnify:CR=1 FL=1
MKLNNRSVQWWTVKTRSSLKALMMDSLLDEEKAIGTDCAGFAAAD